MNLSQSYGTKEGFTNKEARWRKMW